MTVVRPNSISGINSITVATGSALNVHDASGNLIRSLTSSSGVSTFSGIHIGTAATIFANGNVTAGIVTATEFVVGSAVTIGRTNGNATFAGIVTATTFKGSGALTSLDVSGGLGIAESLFHLDAVSYTHLTLPTIYSV